MKQLKTIIVEDDTFNIAAITKIIENHFPEIRIIDTAARVNEAVQKIKCHKPDLLMLDIHLIDGTSFDVIKRCENMDYKIVFMSAYHEYMVKALQYSAIEFIFKPFDINDMITAIDKAIDELRDKNYPLKIKTLFNNIEQYDSKIILQGSNQVKACSINEIAWAKAVQGGANFHLSDQSCFFVDRPLRRYEAMLNDFSFFRCHPRFLINPQHIQELIRERGCLKMTTGDEIIYEQRRHAQLLELINHNKVYA
ncbi:MULTISPECIES: LytR/AlgR family response regulator transcription factor [unclassified Carboxylicivirga]|uniref:LytR/AlgR family response regulator transcription factor n=1 Tax=Carboxylicivirga TaxID=1628153 RepID=UPI003D3285A4